MDGVYQQLDLYLWLHRHKLHCHRRRLTDWSQSHRLCQIAAMLSGPTPHVVETPQSDVRKKIASQQQQQTLLTGHRVPCWWRYLDVELAWGLKHQSLMVIHHCWVEKTRPQPRWLQHHGLAGCHAVAGHAAAQDLAMNALFHLNVDMHSAAPDHRTHQHCQLNALQNSLLPCLWHTISIPRHSCWIHQSIHFGTIHYSSLTLNTYLLQTFPLVSTEWTFDTSRDFKYFLCSLFLLVITTRSFSVIFQ